MIVYRAFCAATGKSYIGCTARSLPQRREEHTLAASNGSPYKFHKALLTQGFNAFSWEVIARASNVPQMYQLEKAMVEKYQSFRNGYNSTPGGAEHPDWLPRPRKASSYVDTGKPQKRRMVF